MSGNNNTTLTAIGLVSVAVIFGAYAYEKGLRPNFGSWFGSGIVAGQIPACDSPATISLATRAFHEAPRIKQLGVSIQRMNPPEQTSEQKDDAGVVIRRGCLTAIYTNSGLALLGFTMIWTTPAKNEVWLEIPILPF